MNRSSIDGNNRVELHYRRQPSKDDPVIIGAGRLFSGKSAPLATDEDESHQYHTQSGISLDRLDLIVLSFEHTSLLAGFCRHFCNSICIC
jgi:hypothetical protein